MRPLVHGSWVLSLVGLLGIAWPLPGQDDYLKRALSDLATREGKKLLVGKKLQIDQPRFGGTFEAVNPQERFRATVHAFKFANDQARVKLTLSNPCKLEGKVKGEGGPLGVTVHMEVDLALDGTVALLMRGDAVVLKPTVNDLGITISRLAVRPPELGVEEKNLAEALNTEFQTNKDAIRKYLNGVLKEHDLK
jgi:hypothetical protein